MHPHSLPSVLADLGLSTGATNDDPERTRWRADELDWYAIRIDIEAPLEGILEHTKQEIRDPFHHPLTSLASDLSAASKLGFGEALAKPGIYEGSKQSVVHSDRTKIDFDIHRNNQSLHEPRRAEGEGQEQLREEPREVLFAGVPDCDERKLGVP